MSLRKRVATVAATVAALAVVAPVATAGAAPQLPQLPLPFTPGQDNSNICLSGLYDPGPLGPMGPYGPLGPYGRYGPLAGQPNPVGNVAECGGLLTYVLRGGTLSSFVQGNLNSVHPGAGG